MRTCILKRTAIVGFVSALVLPLSSYALLPVTDFGSYVRMAQEIKQLANQYKLLKQTYDNAQQQLSKAQELANDSEGHYGFGNLLNSNSDLKNRQWSPDNWQDTLKGLSGGNPSRYKQLVAQYKQNHPSMDQSQFAQSTSKTQASQYNQDVQTNRAANVNASYAFNNINQELSKIHQLSAQIEQTKNTKAAMDLNSRLVAELAYVQAQEVKMQAIMSQQMAQQGADEITAKTERAKFNADPEPNIH